MSVRDSDSRPIFPGVKGDLPVRQTAPLSFQVRDHQIVVSQLDNDPISPELLTLYSVLVRELQSVRGRLESSNTDPRLLGVLHNLNKTITNDFQALDVIKFGVEGQILRTVFKIAKGELSIYEVGIIQSIVDIHYQLVNNIPKWRIFSIESSGLYISEEDAQFVKTQSVQIASSLSELADHVWDNVPQVFLEASELIGPREEDNSHSTLYSIRLVETLVVALASHVRDNTQDNETIGKGSRYRWVAEEALRLIKPTVISLSDRFSQVIGWIPGALRRLGL